MIRISPPAIGQFLTFAQNGSNIIFTVRYRLVLDQIDRHFAANGVRYYERIRIRGADAGSDSILGANQYTAIIDSIVPGNGSQTIERERVLPPIARNLLQEDIGADNDEIICEIALISPDFPTVVNPNGPDTDGTQLNGGVDGTRAALRLTNQITLAG